MVQGDCVVICCDAVSAICYSVQVEVEEGVPRVLLFALLGFGEGVRVVQGGHRREMQWRVYSFVVTRDEDRVAKSIHIETIEL